MSEATTRGAQIEPSHAAGHGRWWTLLALATGFIALGLLAHDAQRGTALDHAVLGWMIEHRHSGITTAAVAITNGGSPVAMTVLALLAAAILWWRRRSPVPGLILLATLGVAAGTSTLTKALVGAQRPPRSVQLLLEVDPSFPSGHVTGTLALSGTLAVAVGVGRPRSVRISLAACVVTATAAVAFTRLYLGVHWVSDIGGGVLLGGAAVLLGAAATRAVTSAHPETVGGCAECAAATVTAVA